MQTQGNHDRNRFQGIFHALAQPFEAHELKTRIGAGRRELTYITARTAMNRLDTVLGPHNWWDEYEVGRDNSVICRLTVRFVDSDGEFVVTKSGTGVTAASVGEDAEKGGEADALKRAAVKFGVARYLYQDGVAGFSGEDLSQAPAPAPAPRSGNGYQSGGGQRPQPQGGYPQQQQRPQGGNGNGHGRREFGPPQNARQLFAFAKSQEEQLGLRNELIQFLEGVANQLTGSGRIYGIQDHQIPEALSLLQRQIASYQGGGQAPAPAPAPAPAASTYDPGDGGDDIPF